jgi:hypothetical protein
MAMSQWGFDHDGRIYMLPTSAKTYAYFSYLFTCPPPHVHRMVLSLYRAWLPIPLGIQAFDVASDGNQACALLLNHSIAYVVHHPRCRRR